MAVKFGNNAATLLASNASSSTTALTVVDGSVFPTLSGSDYTYITLEDVDANREIVKLTARSGNTLTVVRAQDGSSARAFSAADKCELRITAALLNDLNTDADTESVSISGDTMTGALLGTTASFSGSVTAASVVVSGNVDGRDVATDGTKLDGIEASATADQTNAEIRTAVEAASDSNVFTDDDHTKLNAIEASATADQTGAQIKTAYEAETNAFTDAQFTKLGGIEASATADQTAAEIRALVESATDSNVFTDADHTKLNAVEASADVTDAINVESAGALMDSELTAIASVKALNQGVATTDSPTFSNLTLSGTASVKVPSGTTAQRDGTPANGMFRYNSTNEQFEGYQSSAWGAIGGGGGSNTFTTDTFTGNGTVTAYALSQVINSENNLMVFIGGVFQQQSAYSIATASGVTTLTFSEAPANTREIVIYSIAGAVSGSNLNNDQFTANGSTTAFTLSIAPVHEANTMVFIDGVYQQKTDYAVSGTTLTFDAAPANSSVVEVSTFTQTDINVPVDGSVTSAKIASDVALAGNPTAATQATGNTTTRLATTAFVQQEVTTTATSIGTKLPLSGGTLTGTLQGTRVGIGVAAHSSAALNITTTDQHIRFNNGSELGIIDLDSDGELNIWAHGDGEVINLRTGSGAGSDIVKISPTGIDVTGNVTIPTGNKIAFDTDGYTYITEDVDERLRFYVASTEFMRMTNTGTDEIRLLPYGGTVYTSSLDVTGTVVSSGNVLVGNTDPTPYDRTSGNAIALGDGLISSAQSGGNAAIFNRMTNDGSIVQFRKDGAVVGSIGTDGGELYVGSGDVGLLYSGDTNAIIPFNPVTGGLNGSSVDLGLSGTKFKDLYLSGGVYLGGTGAANKLSDYETGTFSGTAQGSVYDGTYTKVGRICHISMTIDNTSSTGTQIASLPFSAKNGGTHFNGAQPTFNTTYNYDDMFIAPYNGGSACYGYSSAGVTLNASSGSVHVNFVYETD